MELLVIISMLALVELVVFANMTGYARGKYNVPAPAISGNEMFERFHRVHYNTIEQMIVFLPSLWAFGYFIGQYWAAGLGLVFLVGRIIYAVSYIRHPASRGPGMLLSILPCWILLAGALVGAAISWLSA